MLADTELKARLDCRQRRLLGQISARSGMQRSLLDEPLESLQNLSLFGAQPVSERVIIDRNRITGGGVTAGIDFAVTLTGSIRGTEHAQLVQLGLE